MRPRHVAAATVLVLVGSTLVVGPARAQPAERDGHFPASITTTVPAGGSSTITSPSIGNAKSVQITVQPEASATDEEAAVFDQFLNSMGTLSKSKRLLVCVILHSFVASGSGSILEDDVKYQTKNAAAAFVILGACLRLAGLVSSESRVGAHRSGTACGRTTVGVPARLRKHGRTYTLTVNGTTRKPKKQPLRVTCRVRGHQIVYRVRATKKGTPLRKVVGNRLAFGVQSPGDASTSVPVKVTFATP